MKYISVSEAAKRWSVSERSVRNYCANGKIENAFLIGKTWNIPENALKPERVNKRKEVPTTLLEVLRREKASNLPGGIYHKVQIELTYNSNHIEGSRLSHEQIRCVLETNTIGVENETINVDDIVETANHFKCIDMSIDNAGLALSEHFIKQLHSVLINGTSDSRKDWFAVGEYKRIPNEVGGRNTTPPSEVRKEITNLLNDYNKTKNNTFDEIIDFHYKFESIHPFQGGNGRIGRLILFKECLRNNIVPFIIDDDLKVSYFRGLSECKRERGYLRDTCLTAQDKFKKYMDYYQIPYID